uniref:Uncharacterized protein n=1 Tax=Trichogramma kaykai TaxID=54128 RepID=A0ABD2X6Z9_9HYME
MSFFGGGDGNASTGSYTEIHGPSIAVVFFENPTAVTSFCYVPNLLFLARASAQARSRRRCTSVRRRSSAWLLMWVLFPINALKREEDEDALLVSMTRNDEK